MVKHCDGVVCINVLGILFITEDLSVTTSSRENYNTQIKNMLLVGCLKFDVSKHVHTNGKDKNENKKALIETH